MNSREDAQEIHRKSPQTAGVISNHNEWREWAGTLRRFGLEGLAAWLLEGGKPLALLSAQMLHFGAPFLGGAADRMANVLESDDLTDELVQFLEQPGGVRKGTHSG